MSDQVSFHQFHHQKIQRILNRFEAAIKQKKAKVLKERTEAKNLGSESNNIDHEFAFFVHNGNDSKVQYEGDGEVLYLGKNFGHDHIFQKNGKGYVFIQLDNPKQKIDIQRSKNSTNEYEISFGKSKVELVLNGRVPYIITYTPNQENPNQIIVQDIHHFNKRKKSYLLASKTKIRKSRKSLAADVMVQAQKEFLSFIQKAKDFKQVVETAESKTDAGTSEKIFDKKDVNGISEIRKDDVYFTTYQLEKNNNNIIHSLDGQIIIECDSSKEASAVKVKKLVDPNEYMIFAGKTISTLKIKEGKTNIYLCKTVQGKPILLDRLDLDGENIVSLKSQATQILNRKSRRNEARKQNKSLLSTELSKEDNLLIEAVGISKREAKNFLVTSEKTSHRIRRRKIIVGEQSNESLNGGQSKSIYLPKGGNDIVNAGSKKDVFAYKVGEIGEDFIFDQGSAGRLVLVSDNEQTICSVSTTESGCEVKIISDGKTEKINCSNPFEAVAVYFNDPEDGLIQLKTFAYNGKVYHDKDGSQGSVVCGAVECLVASKETVRVIDEGVSKEIVLSSDCEDVRVSVNRLSQRDPKKLIVNLSENDKEFKVKLRGNYYFITIGNKLVCRTIKVGQLSSIVARRKHEDGSYSVESKYILEPNDSGSYLVSGADRNVNFTLLNAKGSFRVEHDPEKTIRFELDKNSKDKKHYNVFLSGETTPLATIKFEDFYVVTSYGVKHLLSGYKRLIPGTSNTYKKKDLGGGLSGVFATNPTKDKKQAQWLEGPLTEKNQKFTVSYDDAKDTVLAKYAPTATVIVKMSDPAEVLKLKAEMIKLPNGQERKAIRFYKNEAQGALIFTVLCDEQGNAISKVMLDRDGNIDPYLEWNKITSNYEVKNINLGDKVANPGKKIVVENNQDAGKQENNKDKVVPEGGNKKPGDKVEKEVVPEDGNKKLDNKVEKDVVPEGGDKKLDDRVEEVVPEGGDKKPGDKVEEVVLEGGNKKPGDKVEKVVPEGGDKKPGDKVEKVVPEGGDKKPGDKVEKVVPEGGDKKPGDKVEKVVPEGGDKKLDDKVEKVVPEGGDKKPGDKVEKVVPEGGDKKPDDKVEEVVPEGGDKKPDDKVKKVVPEDGNKKPDDKVEKVVPEGGNKKPEDQVEKVVPEGGDKKPGDKVEKEVILEGGDKKKLEDNKDLEQGQEADIADKKKESNIIESNISVKAGVENPVTPVEGKVHVLRPYMKDRKSNLLIHTDSKIKITRQQREAEAVVDTHIYNDQGVLIIKVIGQDFSSNNVGTIRTKGKNSATYSCPLNYTYSDDLWIKLSKSSDNGLAAGNESEILSTFGQGNFTGTEKTLSGDYLHYAGEKNGGQMLKINLDDKKKIIVTPNPDKQAFEFGFVDQDKKSAKGFSVSFEQARHFTILNDKEGKSNDVKYVYLAEENSYLISNTAYSRTNRKTLGDIDNRDLYILGGTASKLTISDQNVNDLITSYAFEGDRFNESEGKSSPRKVTLNILSSRNDAVYDIQQDEDKFSVTITGHDHPVVVFDLYSIQKGLKKITTSNGYEFQYKQFEKEWVLLKEPKFDQKNAEDEQAMLSPMKKQQFVNLSKSLLSITKG